MTKCGCETGTDCTKTTVCQCAYTADVLAEALEALVESVRTISVAEAYDNAQDALREYKA